MSKMLLSFSCLSLIILAAGAAFFPHSSIFWMASTSGFYQFIRLGLALILLVQIVTDPPRSVFFRLLSGLISLSIGIWAVEATYSYHMMWLDSLSLLSAAVAIAITSLELQPDPDELMAELPL